MRMAVCLIVSVAIWPPKFVSTTRSFDSSSSAQRIASSLRVAGSPSLGGCLSGDGDRLNFEQAVHGPNHRVEPVRRAIAVAIPSVREIQHLRFERREARTMQDLSLLIEPGDRGGADLLSFRC